MNPAKEDHWKEFRQFLTDRKIGTSLLNEIVQKHSELHARKSELKALEKELGELKARLPKDEVSIEELRFENREITEKAENLKREITRYQKHCRKTKKRLDRLSTGHTPAPSVSVEKALNPIERDLATVNEEIRKLWTQKCNGQQTDVSAHTRVFQAYTRNKEKLVLLKQEVAEMEQALVRK